MSHEQVNQSSGNVELYTPAKLANAGRMVLGGFDLDPASSEVANKNIRAKAIFTEDDDGLVQPWEGRVWMNHPWGAYEKKCLPARKCKKKKCKKRKYHLTKDFAGNAAWINKLHDSYVSGDVESAICITYASTSEKWFKNLKKNYAICYLDGRTSFFDPEGNELPQNTKGCAVTYMGDDIAKFNECFSSFGDVMLPYVLLSKLTPDNRLEKTL